jgi:hypothetical protein
LLHTQKCRLLLRMRNATGKDIRRTAIAFEGPVVFRIFDIGAAQRDEAARDDRKPRRTSTGSLLRLRPKGDRHI